MSAEGEFAEEDQIALLFVHEEEVAQEGLGVEAVFLKASNLQPHCCAHQLTIWIAIGRLGRGLGSLLQWKLLVDKLAFVIYPIKL